MNEDLRNKEINHNNEKIIKGFKRLNSRSKENGRLLLGSVSVIMNDIEKIHINRVKDILIKALNQ